ncbi:copper chaperone PCu(A)C [Aliidiomarina indica]|uniref:copper chaperone PCu(A)C n=1 Tax=Aliidiomarina indica TaxID=2749147 RepID=UPI00188F90F3|nr:copper chaperone PCu(A)C [Aliidiomarina indica]
MKWCGVILAGLLSFTAIASEINIDAEDLWLRQSIPGQSNGAGFGTITNHGSEDLLLIGGSIAIADDVEVHRHVREGEQVRMEAMDALTIPAGQSVQLQPGGYHFMLMTLSEPLVVGDYHDLTLVFSNGETVKVKVPVKELVQSQSSSHHGHH